MSDIETIEQTEKLTLESKGDYFIQCKRCRFHLTGSNFALSIEGHHEHIQCNPQGLTFVFKCFSKVPGSFINGISTLEYSWFPGYAWQFSHCQSCGEHLGWYFKNTDNDPFFGLINDKIISVEKESS